jgi:hypothetical protein
MTSLWMSNRMLRVAFLAVASSWVAVTTAQSQTAIDREIIEARKTYGSCLQQWISSMASSPDSAEEIVNTAYRNCRTFNAALCSLNEKKYNKVGSGYCQDEGIALIESEMRPGMIENVGRARQLFKR